MAEILNLRGKSPDNESKHSEGHGVHGALGRFLKLWRTKSNRDLDDLAQSLGFDSPTRILDYESGKESIPLEDIFAMSNELNIPPEEVLQFIDELVRTHFAGRIKA